MVDPCDVLGVATSGAGPGWAALLDTLPPVRMASCQRAVVLTTHLDEDVCAAGGLIAQLAQRAVPIDVLAITDGDGAAEGDPGAARLWQVARRLAGQRVAYERLGASEARFAALALVSGKVHDHRADVVAALSEIIGYVGDPGGVWVLAPWRGERHPDHTAVGEAAALVCHPYRARLVEYCVGAWTERPLADPGWATARVSALDPVAQARKRYAVCATRPLRSGDRVGRHELYFVTGRGRAGRPAPENGSPDAGLG